MKIFTGNLSYNVTEADLHRIFETFGQVSSATIPRDPESERSKGSGFVEMSDPDEARSAIMALNGRSLKGRTITVNEARPDSEDRRDKDRGDRRGRGQY